MPPLKATPKREMTRKESLIAQLIKARDQLREARTPDDTVAAQGEIDQLLDELSKELLEESVEAEH
jgi:hypothetical protein